MQRYFAVITVILLTILVLSRVILMKKKGIKAVRFGEMDKRDFIIPPVALLFFYLVFASTFHWPILGSELFNSIIAGWIGVALCLLGLTIFLLSLISFGTSFRVGIDEDQPGPLVTTGMFAISRNPLYVAFALVLLGIFLMIPNWILFVCFIVGVWLFNRQVLREEGSLKKIYGKEYLEYCKKVHRYL